MFKAGYDDYADDYENLGNLWDDIKAKIFQPIFSAIAPSVPDITYRIIAPKAPAQVTTQYQPQVQVVEKPVIPAWVMPVGIGLVALLVVPRLIKTH
jgi:hypothetical protein